MAIQEFFCGAEILKFCSSTLIALILKISNPSCFSDYRPISLTNFLNKVISKILASRLEAFLPKLISKDQSGVVKGRLIPDNILLSEELLCSINKKTRGSNIALKLDMAKAFDKVSWPYLCAIFRAFGFSEMWIDLIWRCISNSHFSIIINGEAKGFFKSTRGIRQGDPLSPSLFIISAELLSRSLNLLLENTAFAPYVVPKSCSPISHLSYADDVIIFSSGKKKSLLLIMKTIRNYELCSGQKINVQKSSFITGSSLAPDRKEKIKRITGFSHKLIPVKYLGCPLFYGRKKKTFWRTERSPLAGTRDNGRETNREW